MIIASKIQDLCVACNVNIASNCSSAGAIVVPRPHPLERAASTAHAQTQGGD